MKMMRDKPEHATIVETFQAVLLSPEQSPSPSSGEAADRLIRRLRGMVRERDREIDRLKRKLGALGA